MKNHTKTQRHALELLRARLDPKHPMFAASDHVAHALGDSDAAGLYLRTWVLPLVDYLLNGEAFYGEGGTINREHAARSASATARRQFSSALAGAKTSIL